MNRKTTMQKMTMRMNFTPIGTLGRQNLHRMQGTWLLLWNVTVVSGCRRLLTAAKEIGFCFRALCKYQHPFPACLTVTQCKRTDIFVIPGKRTFKRFCKYITLCILERECQIRQEEIKLEISNWRYQHTFMIQQMHYVYRHLCFCWIRKCCHIPMLISFLSYLLIF